MNALFESLTGCTLVHVHTLWLVLVIPIALWTRRRAGRATVLFAPAAAVDITALPRTWRTRCVALPRLLHVAGLALVVVALARPVHRDPLPPTTEGIDIVLCLDTSSSMTARDLDPKRSRLDVAKDAAAEFISGRPHDHIGLITFARYPDLRCPPTLDHGALLTLLGAVAPVESDGPEDATGIGTATARAAQVLRTSASKSRVVVLLTDGEENVATAGTPAEIAPVYAAQLCVELGVRVYTIAAGLGDEGPQGARVAVDTTQVRDLARKTGGEFADGRNAADVVRMYARINELEKATFSEPQFRTEERFAAVLVTALLVMLVGRLLRVTALDVLP